MKFVAVCFFFNNTPTTEIYTLPLHAALPISPEFDASAKPRDVFHLPRHPRQFGLVLFEMVEREPDDVVVGQDTARVDRKSTRLNSSHSQISYAVFCLKKKIQPSQDGKWRQSLTTLP